MSGANPSGYLRLHNTGYVGIGTAIPLDVRSVGNSFVRVDATFGDLHFNGGPDGFFGLVNEGPVTGRTEIISSNGVLFSVVNNGKIGIGTTAPGGKLDVRGDIKLGTSGQCFAPASEENLRIIRGHVDSDGTPTLGCCYSVSKCGTGCYQITYNQAFAGVPTVMVTANQTATVLIAGLGPGSTPTASGVRVITNYGSGSLNVVDDQFDFIAIGPR